MVKRMGMSGVSRRGSCAGAQYVYFTLRSEYGSLWRRRLSYRPFHMSPPSDGRGHEHFVVKIFLRVPGILGRAGPSSAREQIQGGTQTALQP